MIDKPTDGDKYIIWTALVHAISSDSGIGFSCNADQGHPVYRRGMEGEIVHDSADTPETSDLFKLLASFDPVFHEEYQDLSTWEKFCSFAVESHDRVRHTPRKYGVR